jgi:hypothetical protein
MIRITPLTGCAGNKFAAAINSLAIAPKYASGGASDRVSCIWKAEQVPPTEDKMIYITNHAHAALAVLQPYYIMCVDV